MKGNKFRGICFIAGAVALLLAGCGLLLGPLPQISLVQKLTSSKWTKIEMFNNYSGGFANSTGKMFTLVNGGYNYLYNYFSINAAGMLTLNSFATNMTFMPAFATLLNTSGNIFDLDDQGTNASSSYVFWVSDTSNLNRMTPPYASEGSSVVLTSFMSFMYLFLADNQIVGIQPQDSLLSYNFTSAIPGGPFYSQGGTPIMKVVKCRQRYKNERLFVIANASTGIQIGSMQQLYVPLLNDFYTAPIVPNYPLFIESDGDQRLYLIVESKLLRYDSAGKSLQEEANLYQVNIDLTKMIFIGDNLLIFTVMNGSFIVHIFNTVMKDMVTTIKLPVSDASNINSFDVIHSPVDDRIFVNYVTCTGSFWSGYTLINE